MVGNSHFNGTIGIGIAPSTTEELTVNGTSYFSGEIGIATAPQPGISLLINGKVGIGSIPSFPGIYGLYVADGILTEKVKVTIKSSAGWMDYVFAKDYNLRSIRELECYIKENGSLPDIPTTQEVLENGIDLGEIQAKLLQKIEELTLYIIDQERRIEALESGTSK